VETGYFISICVNVLIALVLVLIEHIVLNHPFQWMWRPFLDFVIAGCFTTFLGRWMYFHAIVRAGPAKASTIQIANPVVTVLLAWFVIGEVLTGVEWIGCIFTVLGLFVISYVPGVFSRNSKNIKQTGTSTENLVQPILPKIPAINRLQRLASSGSVLAILSVIAYGVGNIFRGLGMHDWNDAAFGGLVGTIVGLLAFSASNARQLRAITDVRAADRKGMLMYACGGVLTITAQISVLAAMRYLPIGLVTVISMSQPLLVIPLSVIIFKGTEQITKRTISGSLLALVGLVLAVLGRSI